MGVYKTRRELTGQRFGRLTVVEYDHTHNGSAYWKCKCDCGNEKIISSNSLTQGNATSCGCYRKEYVSAQKKTHGMSKTRIYREFRAMKTRCTNENIEEHHRYSGRGINICDEWMGKGGFERFMKWAYANGYSDDLSIDRIDNDKGYSPDNCRWVDRITQANNTSLNHNITINGETHTMMEWSQITGISYSAIKGRINKLGWSPEEALGFREHSKITKTSRVITIDNESYTMAEWARKRNIKYSVVQGRLALGWTEREALGFDVHQRKTKKSNESEVKA